MRALRRDLGGGQQGCAVREDRRRPAAVWAGVPHGRCDGAKGKSKSSRRFLDSLRSLEMTGCGGGAGLGMGGVGSVKHGTAHG